MATVSSMSRIASTAAWSALSLSPRPIQRAALIAAASVTRTSSRARLRSGAPTGGAPSPAAGSVTAGCHSRPRRRGLHPLGSRDADQVEAPCDHRPRRPHETEAEGLLVAAEHPVLVVEAVEVVGDADR